MQFLSLVPKETSRAWLKERLLHNIEENGHCWEWQGAKDTCGYGHIRTGRQTLRAHRLAYALLVTDFCDALSVCHTCDNPCCINPDHLFLATHKENMRDCAKKGRIKSKSIYSL